VASSKQARRVDEKRECSAAILKTSTSIITIMISARCSSWFVRDLSSFFFKARQDRRYLSIKPRLRHPDLPTCKASFFANQEVLTNLMLMNLSNSNWSQREENRTSARRRADGEREAGVTMVAIEIHEAPNGTYRSEFNIATG